jgi:GntR family transcriptional regulator/MocR family aminotransferase
VNPWATSGGRQLDLHLDAPRPGEGVRARLERSLREAVRGGRLAPGTRLPSSRTLAADLGVARNTVAEAYAQLVAEGYLTARQGSGTRVAEDGHPEAAPLPRTQGPFARRAPLPYDLRPGVPDLSLFPRADWLAASRRALNTLPHHALGYGDPRGTPELRAALAGYLARVRGVRADPGLLVVCTGFVQAVGVVAGALAAHGGRRVAVEALGLPETAGRLRRCGLETVPLPVDVEGARTDLVPGDACAVLLTPAHQFPTGVPLSPARRAAATTWARHTGGLVVEDDYDGEFRYDRQPVGALQGLAPDRVIYAGTASKSLAPGLRLAWLLVPPALLDAVVEEKRWADLHSPVLDQLALAELIASGAYDRHVRRARARYRRRRDRLVAELAAAAPRVRVTGIAAGLHALVEVPGDARAVVAEAARRGLGLQSLAEYGAPADTRSVVVGYATPPEHAFPAALALLCEVLRGVR